MSQKAAASSLDVTVGEAIASVLSAYDELEMPVSRYLGLVVAPAGVFLVASVVAATVLELPLSARVPIGLLGVLLFAAALLYPRIVVSQRRVDMENRFHLVMTHMTVLSTTNIDRMAVFRTLSNEPEYGVFAEELRRVVQLVDTWNQSLDEACRRRAKAIPSKPISDFLDRLAYTLGAGQALSEFLISEQEVMRRNYATVYESSLNNLEVMKDLYLSMVLSMTFALVFAIVLPVLTGTNPTMTVAAVIVLYVFVQLGFFFVIRTMSPYDPLWYYPEDRTAATEPRLVVSLVVGVALTVALIYVTGSTLFGFGAVTLYDLVPVANIPRPLFIAIPITPLLIPGAVYTIEENRIKARDGEFPSFIRALGASESAKQSTTSKVLSTLRDKDFGPLTDDIDNLYKRLNMRIEPAGAWDHFAVDTRSYLIQKFSEMYLVGRQMGGDPKQLGEIISQNMNEVNQLRERRKQAAVTLIGLLYGISAAATFAFFIGLQVVRMLAGMSLELSASPGFNVGQLIHTNVYDIPLIQFLLLVVVLFNALLSSLMIRTVDGGNKTNSFTHFVVLTWIGALTAVVTQELVGSVLSV